MAWETEISALPGVGEKKAAAFRKLGVRTLGDMVGYFPRKYEDRSVICPITSAVAEQTCCVRAMVSTQPTLSRVRRGMQLVKFRAADESGVIEITYFNQPYAKNQFQVGETYTFYGKVGVIGKRKTMTNPIHEKAGEGQVTRRIVPIYRTTAGLGQKALLQAAEISLDRCEGEFPDLLPKEVAQRHQLCAAAYAYRNIHFPEDFLSLEIARRRLIFEELFTLACALQQVHGERTPQSGIPISADSPEPFYASLPFSPTGAQDRAIQAIFEDLRSGYAMNRLVQGDVGSGKTLVAAAAIWAAARTGYLSVMMAPTEILVEQHFRTLTQLLGAAGVRVELLTGSMTAKEKRLVKQRLAGGEVDVLVGTHAVLTGDVELPGLALVIVDEQHRFGVEQRAALAAKGKRPHVLVMSATPIPRTLALIIYGDLDVSVIDELPPGRQKVDTLLVNESYRQRLNGFIRKQVEEGRQVFVVCPKVEEDEDGMESGLHSAQEHAVYLQGEFPDLRVRCIHGRMKAREKEEIMAAMVAGAVDILVSTTVIEVGVDVPNANLMVIENAERFGLSQLHQLRGRIGRGPYKSWCVLVSDSKGDVARERLKIMTKLSDGFAISEEDLRLRGPGDFFGNRQHGLPETHIADLGADMQVLTAAQEEAHALLERDPELKEYPVLRRRVEQMLQTAGNTFN